MFTVFSISFSFPSEPPTHDRIEQLEEYYREVKTAMNGALRSYMKLQRVRYHYEQIPSTFDLHEHKERASIREAKQDEKFLRLHDGLVTTLKQYEEACVKFEMHLSKVLPKGLLAKCIARLYYRELSKISDLDIRDLSRYEIADCTLEDSVLVSVERDFQLLNKPNLIKRILRKLYNA